MAESLDMESLSQLLMQCGKYQGSAECWLRILFFSLQHSVLGIIVSLRKPLYWILELGRDVICLPTGLINFVLTGLIGCARVRMTSFVRDLLNC